MAGKRSGELVVKQVVKAIIDIVARAMGVDAPQLSQCYEPLEALILKFARPEVVRLQEELRSCRSIRDQESAKWAEMRGRMRLASQALVACADEGSVTARRALEELGLRQPPSETVVAEESDSDDSEGGVAPDEDLDEPELESEDPDNW